ncbi:hypothetical protein [Comamonas sp.]|uniref:hypothetical protein n=1 Tax=Comamonas sp. TaxID=34028 RepID=UPI003A935664
MSRAFAALSDYDKAGQCMNVILRCVSRNRIRQADYEPLMYAVELASRAVLAAMPRTPPEESEYPDLVELGDFIDYYGDGLRNDEAFARHAAWVAQRQQGHGGGGRGNDGERP